MCNFGYCFLSDIGCGNFDENSLSIISMSPHKNVFQINKKEYKDPDLCSQKLYNYHTELWNKVLPSGQIMSEIVINSYNSGYKITAKVGEKNVYLGSDYIGFSKNWIPKEIDKKDIENALMK